jgi:hypothetical protein
MKSPEITDPGLSRCAYKKATVSFTKHILLVSNVIVAITAFILAGVGSIVALTTIWAIIGEPLINGVNNVIRIIETIVFAIPWYIYVVAAIPIAYFWYGILWCIARKLTEDDWKSVNLEYFFDVALVRADVALAGLL